MASDSDDGAVGTEQRDRVSGTEAADDDDEDEDILVATTHDVTPIASILNSINFADEVTACMSENGIKFCVEASKTVQARVFLQSELFDTFIYNCEDEQCDIRIPFSSLLKCINIFGSQSTSMKMTYAGYGNPLILVLEDDGVVTDCRMRTLETHRSLDFDIEEAEIPCNVIMKSHWLAEVFAHLDTTSETLEMLISPNKPYFRLSTKGLSGSTQIDCPKSSDVVESFKCDQTQANQYRLKLLKPSEKALNLSSKVSIRVNVHGLLSIQFLVHTDGQAVFIEYLCLAEDTL